MLRFPLHRTVPTLCRLGGGAFIVVALALPAAGSEHNCIDLNTASRDQLRMIVHIDEVRSGEIIAKRPWQSARDLRRIDGIGPKRLDDILDQGVACVDGDTGQRQPGERR